MVEVTLTQDQWDNVGNHLNDGFDIVTEAVDLTWQDYEFTKDEETLIITITRVKLVGRITQPTDDVICVEVSIA